MSSESIEDFILKDEQNLRTAVAVSEAWPDARARLVAGFLERLRERLLNELPGWRYEQKWGNYVADRWACFCISKEKWARQYHIALQADAWGKAMLFGVLRDWDQEVVKTRDLSGKLLDAVCQIHPSARATKWWEAVVAMRSPASDWRAPDVLWRMHSEEAFLAGVVEQLLGVARTTEPCLDQLTRND
jgi:hypothetical protein